jgi:HEAT repeat protein
VSALSGIDPSTAVDTLTQAMGDENPNVRQAVVHALAWLNAKPSARILKEALLRDEDSVQQAAAEGLALMGKEEAEALRDIARDSNPAIRRAAIFGLVLLDEPWVLPLVQKLAVDGQWAVQTVASAAVTLLTGTELSEAWEATTLSDQEWLHNWAAQSRRVVPAGPAALSMAEEALEPGQQEIVRLLAIVALGFMSNKKCMPALKRVLEDSASTIVREAVHVAFYQTSRAYDQWVGP